MVAAPAGSRLLELGSVVAPASSRTLETENSTIPRRKTFPFFVILDPRNRRVTVHALDLLKDLFLLVTVPTSLRLPSMALQWTVLQ